MLLPDCDLDGAVATGERIRERLDQEVFDGRKVTVSVGVSEFPTHGETPKELIGAADVALYQAKEQGRDRVVAAGAEPEPPAEEKPPKKKAIGKKKTAPKKKSAAGKKSSSKKKDDAGS